MISNEEKAHEIAKLADYTHDRIDIDIAFKSALEMAEWKDKQYAERIEQLEQALIDSECRCEKLQMELEQLKK